MVKALCLALAAALLITAPLAAQDSPLTAASKKAKEDRANGDGWPLAARPLGDGRSGGLAPAPRVSTPESVPPGRWTSGSSARSLMDDSSTVTLHLDADAPVKAWLKVVEPALVLRCKERVLDTYMVTNTAAAVEYGGSHTVRLRFDSATPVSENWGEATDHAALFAPEPENFLDRLRTTDRLVLEFTPFNASPVILTFDTRGLQHHVNRLLDACPEATRTRR